MAIFLMFGKYSQEASKEISSQRTDEAMAVIRKHGGDIRSLYAVMGELDLVFAVDFPGMKEAMAASVELKQKTGISFSTSPVMDLNEFDGLAGKREETP